MLRVVHSADWHIGQTLNNWPRQTEHELFFGFLADLIEREAADALIIAGDVYETQNPSAEAQRLLYESLAALHRRRPHLTIVMVAGNHDPAGRLEAPDVLLRAIGVHTFGHVHRRPDGAIALDRHLVPLRDAQGRVGAHVLAVPFLRPHDLPGLSMAGDAPDSPIIRATRMFYAEAIAAARAAITGPLIVTGHLHVAGGAESEGAERRILIGGEHAVPPDIFPNAADYVALGHLHKAQALGRPTIRYAGSPFPMSAAELGYQHGVSLIEITETATEVRHLPLPRPVPCLRVPQRGALALGDLAAALDLLALDAALPIGRRPFVYSVIAADGPTGGLPAEIDRILERYPLRSAGIKIERPRAVLSSAEPATRLAECDPADLFARAFAALHGVPPGLQHLDAFHHVASDL